MNSIFLILTACFAIVLSILYLRISHSASSHTKQQPFADFVLKNGVVFTADQHLPTADSFAVSNGIIVRVGNYSSIKPLIGNSTKELDAEGRVIVPGFIDSHVHFIFGGLQMKRVDMNGVDEKGVFVRRVEEAVRNLKEGQWLLGGGWNNDLWGGELPCASWIDHITPNNPVWLSRVDRHMGLANTIALRIAGINGSSNDSPAGSIVKLINGEASGLLIDEAMNLVMKWIPERSKEERREALRRASDYALSKGVTTVVDFGRYIQGGHVGYSWDDFSDVYQWADSLGMMKVRACLFFPIESWSNLKEVLLNEEYTGSGFVHLGGVKAFFDGSLGSSSALFHEPYENELGNIGMQVVDKQVLLKMIMAADEAAIQVAVHAIGDKANDEVLKIYESVISMNEKRDRRFRIEHAQHLSPETPHRFGELGVMASVQPLHLLIDADPAVKKLGFERAEKGLYLFRSLRNNTELALGSDWPVADIDPLRSISIAMKRVPSGWSSAWSPEERLPLNDALISHTISGARACFLDRRIGSITEGKFADFVVLSATSLSQFESAGDIFVESTYVGGKLRFKRNSRD